MAQRPNFIALPPRTASSSAHTSPAIPPSPRREYVTGETAPAMSPLDNLAAQSRALARQLEDNRKFDHRVSRLPPLTVADGLVKRPGPQGQSPASAGPTSGGLSAGLGAGTSAPGHGPGPSFHATRPPPISPPSEQSGIKMHIESPTNRPNSIYPRYGQAPPPRFDSAPRVDSALAERGEWHEGERFLTPQESFAQDYFDAPRTHSPERSGPGRASLESASQKSSYSSMSKSKASMDSYRNAPLSRGASIESSSSRFSQYSDQLQPPNPPYARKTPSLRSISSEDDNPGITPSSSYSQRRKLSSSSGTSLPLSPHLQYKPAHNRSTSQLSEISVGGTRYSRPSYNFSRPLSRQSGRPSTDSPVRPSIEGNTRIYNDDDPRESIETTMSDHESMVSAKADQEEGETSFVYSKYSLPRGRMVDRDSLPLEQLMPKLDLDTSRPPLSPMSPPATSPAPQSTLKPVRPPRRHFVEYLDEDDSPLRTSTDCLPSRPPPPPIPELKHQHRHSMTSMNTSNTSNSASTIKASKQNPTPTATDISAEKHLEKGIALHEAGSLKESTYHLRLAAKGNSPTGMLLYALACRHGWGMRQNPSEGVAWLRKAIDYANVAMNESENAEQGTGVSALQRTQRAQFALGVYELGVSHMNGWGVENDKILALRCFEIASAWGDADAMAEAGFCYYQGLGTKKDLMKAAKYYRQAEAKGVSMVGNSWIHKSKYDEKVTDADANERTSRAANAGGEEKKKRDKSRTRNLFGRKKSER